MDYQEINLADLQNMCLNNGRAARAAEMLREERKTEGTYDLQYLLRHHSESEISSEETYTRDSFDFLLDFYGILEIASLIRYIPSLLPDPMRDEACWNLSNKAVKRYSEEYYPVLLSKLFRLRQERKLSLFEDDTSQATHPLFLRFFGMNNRVQDDEEIELFQWFLDSGSREEYDIEDTLKILQNPHELIQALLAKPENRTIPQHSVSGAQKFLTFCCEFDKLLIESEAFPLLQSQMWFYYSYWFDLISTEVASGLGRILDSFLGWNSEDSEADLEAKKQRIESQVADFWNSLDKDDRPEVVTSRLDSLLSASQSEDLKPDKKEIRVYVTESKGVIERLLSGSYGNSLINTVAGASAE